MGRGSLFWGSVLILLGILFALQAANVIQDVFGWFWPLFLILLGVAILVNRVDLSVTNENSALEHRRFSVDLNDAERLMLEIDHGAGAIRINGGAPPGTALRGTQGATMSYQSQRNGKTLAIELDAGPSFLPFLGPENGAWQFQITNAVPVSIKMECGMASLDFDFTDTQLEFLGLEMGAASLNLKLPAHATRTLVDIESGAASLNITIPQDVAARIRLEQGASSQNIDTARFPQVGEGWYESPDFERAEHRAEINLEGGANNVIVR
ncbi:MAG: hypothetical protein N2117_11085 [Anaerolineales bacterium]|nr:hypothetical protein [Anaerolineales bacterium]MCX7755770.1 hypothetical protein [Anaerolineales bacterium]MDW8279028.1 hypothetical protein [Anaerolineales bacterium]